MDAPSPCLVQLVRLFEYEYTCFRLRGWVPAPLPSAGPPLPGSGARLHLPVPRAPGANTSSIAAVNLIGRVEASGLGVELPLGHPKLGSGLPAHGGSKFLQLCSVLSCQIQCTVASCPAPVHLPLQSLPHPGLGLRTHSTQAHLASRNRQGAGASLGPGCPTPAAVAQRSLGPKEAFRPRTQRHRRPPQPRPPWPARLPSPPPLPSPFLLFFLLSEAAVRSEAEAQPGLERPE